MVQFISGTPVKQLVTQAPGQGPISLGAAYDNGRTAHDAGVPNPSSVLYIAYDGSTFEQGQGGYSEDVSGNATLTRDKITLSSGSSGPLNLSDQTFVYITAIVDTSTNPYAGGTLKANLAFDPTVAGLRITGDLSNSTLSNRLVFQTSVLNAATSLHVIPQGAVTQSGFYAESDPAMANGNAGEFAIYGDELRISNLARGAAIPGNIGIYAGAIRRAFIDSSTGEFSFTGSISLTTLTPVQKLTRLTQFDTGFVQSGVVSSSGSKAWVNPANAQALDAINTTWTSTAVGSSSDYVTATNFNLSVPNTAVIVGIEVAFDRTINANISDQSVRLVIAGSRAGQEKTLSKTTAGLAWSTNQSIYGGAGDMWGVPLTPADVNNLGFGVALSVKGDNGQVAALDAIRIKVLYAFDEGDMAWTTGVDADGSWKLSRGAMFGDDRIVVKGGTITFPVGEFTLAAPNLAAVTISSAGGTGSLALLDTGLDLGTYLGGVAWRMDATGSLVRLGAADVPPIPVVETIFSPEDGSGRFKMFRPLVLGSSLIGTVSLSAYGALSLLGSKGGYGGINFRDSNGVNIGTFIADTNDTYQGWRSQSDTTWKWLWASGSLLIGSVPAARIPDATTFVLASSQITIALGFTPARSGINTDITSISGLTTPLTIAQGGTSATTAANARAALGAGTVSSVALSTPGVLFTVSGSPITSSGTVTFSLVTQPANAVFAGPASGGAAAPTFRSLTSADMPAPFYADANNIGLRSPASSGAIYFQSLGGASIYGYIGPGGMQLNVGAYFGATYYATASSYPQIYWQATGNAVNTKLWQQYIDTSGTLFLTALNDAATLTTNALYITRSGYTVTGINLGALVTTPGLSVTPTANPTTFATATQILVGETNNNAAYKLALGYGAIASSWQGVIQATAAGAGANLNLNPNGGDVIVGSGNLRTSTAIVQSTVGVASIDVSGATFLLNNGANISPAPGRWGEIAIWNLSAGTFAKFIYGYTTSTLIATNGAWSAGITPASGACGFGWDSATSTFRIYNNSGANCSFVAHVTKAG